MFKRILVHLDPQSDSDKNWLVSRLVPLATSFGAQVELFTCGYSRALKQNHMFDSKGEEQAEHSYIRQCEARLEKFTSPLILAGIDVGVDALWQENVVEGILQKAERFDADLVVTELPEHSLFERVFGEMEAELARQCRIPLLLMQKREWNTPPMIAAGLDPFHEDQQPHLLDRHVLEALAAVSAPLKATPRVLHCIHTLPHAAIFDEHVVTDYEALKANVSEEHHNVVDALVKESSLGSDTPIHYLNGEAHQMLPRYAEENQLDLLVMGHAEHGVFDRLLSNDMVTRIMDDLPCDVLVVR
ncbi:MAG: universal stress protein [Marinobacterium sp.]|nr:universal stress protein [Marinobacterium sp.]